MTVSVTGLVCLKPSAFGRRCYRMRTHIGHEGRSGRVIRSGAALVASPCLRLRAGDREWFTGWDRRARFAAYRRRSDD
jgi:hypothetical protein